MIGWIREAGRGVRLHSCSLHDWSKKGDSGQRSKTTVVAYMIGVKQGDSGQRSKTTQL